MPASLAYVRHLASVRLELDQPGETLAELAEFGVACIRARCSGDFYCR